MAGTMERVYGALLDRRYQDALFGDLKGYQEKGDAAIACCPFHEDLFPTLVVYGDRPEYFCFVCSARGDWLRYLELRKGLGFEEALRLLASEAGINAGGLTEALWRSGLGRSILLEILAGFFATQLFSPSGVDALHYLYRRGYAMGEVEGSSFGFYPGHGATLDYLAAQGIAVEHLEPVLKTIWRADAGDYRLTIPYRDSCGRLMGIIGRQAGGSGPEAYRPLTDLAPLEGVPFLMHRARNRENVIVVDGLLDALLLDRIGLMQAVAVGRGGLSPAQADTIAGCGVRRCVLCFAKSEDREGRTREAEALVRARGMDAAVLPLPEGYADLDHFIRGTDLHDFRKLLRKVRKPRKQPSGP